MADYNAQRHFAHEHREDGRKSPDAVLGLYVKPRYQPADLRRIFYEECFERVLDAFGRVRIMHWLLLGNEVFARREVELWVSPDALTVEHGAETLSRYEVEYRAKPSASAGVAGELRQVRCLELFETAHLLPQPRLFGLEKALGDGWIKALKLDGYAPPQRTRRARHTGGLLPSLAGALRVALRAESTRVGTTVNYRELLHRAVPRPVRGGCRRASPPAPPVSG